MIGMMNEKFLIKTKKVLANVVDILADFFEILLDGLLEIIKVLADN